MFLTRTNWKKLLTWESDTKLADERILRQRSIAEGLKDDYKPWRTKITEGAAPSLTNKQLRDRKRYLGPSYTEMKRKKSASEEVKQGRKARHRKLVEDAGNELSVANCKKCWTPYIGPPRS